MKIDSHQHYWHYNTDDYGWIDERMSVIRRDFLPEEFAGELQKNGIDGSIAVQARQSKAETDWLLQLANRHEHIKGVVGWVDMCADDVQQQLAEFARHPKAAGVRHVIHDEPDINFMLNDQFIRGIKLLKELQLTYDILIFPEHLPNTLQFIDSFDEDQIFVIDHIAKPKIKAGRIQPWKEHIQELARHQNVFCKLSGMVTEANWPYQQPADFKPYFDVMFEAFGPDRLMFGSDWPVCLVAEDYASWLTTLTNAISVFSKEDQKKIIGETARKAYRL